MTRGDPLQEGLEQLGAGRFAAARTALESALESSAGGERALAHDRLAAACFALEDYEAGLTHARAAFRLHRAAGDLRRAAFMAILIANLEQNSGNEAAQRGWLARAARLLEGEGQCLEAGYLAVATSACDVRDIGRLEEATRAALEIARRFGDTDLEARALADGGLALVAGGRVEEGMAWLDEAMAAIVSGEVSNHVFAAKSCCAMLHACDRVGDVERAVEWTRAVTEYAAARFGDPPPPILLSHCRIALGTLLFEEGRWPEAEAELRRALETSRAMQKRAEARARLAELLVCQDRLAEAAELLAGLEEWPLAAGAHARLHLARHELEAAEGALRRGLRQFEGDLPATVRLLALLAEVRARRGDASGAVEAGERALEIARALESPGLIATACLAAARARLATRSDGEGPLALLSEAERLLAGAERPVLRAAIHLELALALQKGDPAAAVGEALAALPAFERLGAVREADRAAALLRELGVRSRPAPHRSPALTRRELDVLALLPEGLSNAEIGRRLFITGRTAEHHVASILAKLGLKRRSEAAAYAAQLAGRGEGVAIRR